MLGLVLAAFVVVIPFWEPSNTGLATKDYNTAFWDGESTVSFVYQQYGALALTPSNCSHTCCCAGSYTGAAKRVQ